MACNSANLRSEARSFSWKFSLSRPTSVCVTCTAVCIDLNLSSSTSLASSLSRSWRTRLSLAAISRVWFSFSRYCSRNWILTLDNSSLSSWLCESNSWILCFSISLCLLSFSNSASSLEILLLDEVKSCWNFLCSCKYLSLSARLAARSLLSVSTSVSRVAFAALSLCISVSFDDISFFWISWCLWCWRSWVCIFLNSWINCSLSACSWYFCDTTAFFKRSSTSDILLPSSIT